MQADFAMPLETGDQIEQILARLCRKTKAECVLLADISGQLISIHGDTREIDPVLVATLAAGDVAAMGELGQQLGENSSSGTVLHEGRNRSIFLANVAGSFVLIVIFPASTPVGLVRLFAGRTAEQLHKHAKAFEEYLSQSFDTPDIEFGAALASELEKAFKERGSLM